MFGYPFSLFQRWTFCPRPVGRLILLDETYEKKLLTPNFAKGLAGSIFKVFFFCASTFSGLWEHKGWKWALDQATPRGSDHQRSGLIVTQQGSEKRWDIQFFHRSEIFHQQMGRGQLLSLGRLHSRTHLPSSRAGSSYWTVDLF